MMNLDELLSMTPSELEHHGVKGQKWGVRRAGSAGVRAIKSASKTVGDEAKLRGASIKRERSWAKKDVSGMSTRKLQSTAKRVQLENELKRHARGSGSKDAKRDYLNRANISTKDLKSKVNRLSLEKEFKKSASTATKAQRDLAKSIMKSMANDPTPTGVAVGVLGDQVSSYMSDRKKYNN